MTAPVAIIVSNLPAGNSPIFGAVGFFPADVQGFFFAVNYGNQTFAFDPLTDKKRLHRTGPPFSKHQVEFPASPPRPRDLRSSHARSGGPVTKNVKSDSGAGWPQKKFLTPKPSTHIVHGMNYMGDNDGQTIPNFQLKQFQDLVAKLYQCCQERMQYQCERFGLPDAEFRCLQLFGNERYLTAKGIAHQLNVVKSRVSKIVDGLIRKKLVQRVKDPEDSRIQLISLTPEGQKRLREINGFSEDLHWQVLNQMAPDQRQAMLTNLDLLKASMESVKDMMV
jgi:DNA-binding MarR family transcriptional regulator